jgi:hypothetical protein
LSVQDYLRETGSGIYKPFRVPDLSTARPGCPTQLVIVLESPHADEVLTGVPLSGKAGRDAHRFLAQSTPKPSLGSFVQGRHGQGDTRVALVNVSELPLQAHAIDARVRPLSSSEWIVIEHVRTRTAASVEGIKDFAVRAASVAILEGLQARVDALTLDPTTTIALAGKFAQRFWRALASPPRVGLLEVPHPSIDQWNRASNSQHPGLLQLKSLFGVHTS